MPFNKGLQRDVDPRLQPDGSYRDARNAIIGTEDGELRRERGPSLRTDVGGDIIGWKEFSNNAFLLFVKGDSTDHIKIWDPESESLTSVLSDEDFEEDISFGEYVESVYRVLSNGDRVVYLTDDANPPRLLNVDKTLQDGPPNKLQSLRLFPVINTKTDFKLDYVSKAGGSLFGGTYQLAFAYINSDESVTNYFKTTRPIPISNQEGFGEDPDEKTGRKIDFTLENLDTEYESLRVVAVHGTTVDILPDIPIPDSGTLKYSYTGNESSVDGTLDEVIVDQETYSRARTIEQQDGTLYMGNLEKEDRVDLQRHVNDIGVTFQQEHEKAILSNYTNDAYEATENRNDLLNTEAAFNLKTFKRGEVYAFYVSFVLEDGTETEAFHIPGRRAEGGTGTLKGEASITIDDAAPDPDDAKSEGTITCSDVPGQGEKARSGMFTLTSGASSDGSVDIEYRDDSGNVIETYTVNYTSGDSEDEIANNIETVLENGHFGNDFDLQGAYNYDTGGYSMSMIALSTGAQWNGYGIEIVSSADFNYTTNSTTVDGGKDDDGPEDREILVAYDGNNVTTPVTVNGQDSAATVASAYMTALGNNSNFTDKFTATDNGDGTLTIEADQIGNKYNASFSVGAVNNSNDYESGSLDGGWDSSTDKISVEADWVPSTTEFITFEVAPGASAQTVADKLFTESQNNAGYDDITFTQNTTTITATDDTGTDRFNGDTPYFDSAFSFSLTIEDWEGGGGSGNELSEIPDSHPLKEYESEFGTLRNFHVNPSTSSLSTGFWQNENESYPDNQRWDVVDDSGDVVDNYRGENVRHHRILGNDEMPYVDEDSQFGLTDPTIIQVSFNNIHIPDELEGKIKSARFYYARKDPEDRLIMDQSLGHQGWHDDSDNERPYQQTNSIFSSDVWAAHGFPPTTYFFDEKRWDVDGNLFELQPFESLRRNLPLQGITHVKEVLRITKDDDWYGVFTEDVGSVWWKDGTLNISSHNLITKVEAISYIDQNQRSVSLESQGFTRDYDNLFGESKVVCETEKGFFLDSLHVLDLCQLKKDVHFPFDQQELVYTGIEKDMSTGRSVVQKAIGAGDIHVARWWHKEHTLLALADPDFWGQGDSWWGGNHDENNIKNALLWTIHREIFGQNEDEDERNGVVSAIQELIGNTADVNNLPLAIGTTWFQCNETRDLPTMGRVPGESRDETFAPIQEIFGKSEASWVSQPPVGALPNKFDQLDDTEEAKAKTRWFFRFFRDVDNWYKYNDLYSEDARLKPAFPFQEKAISSTNFPTRVIRSAESKEGGPRTAWREFRPEDKTDLPQNRGAIQKLVASTNGLTIHAEDALFRTKGRQQMDIQGDSVYLGSGNIFRVKPQQLRQSEAGFAGLSHPTHGISTPWGYVWVDIENQTVYQWGNEGPKSISRKGLRQWFQSHIGTDIEIGVDPEEERVFVSGSDWTLSYNPLREQWVSFHDLDPGKYFFGRDKGHLFRNDNIYTIGEGQYGNYYGSIHPFEVAFVSADRRPENQIVQSLYIDASVFDDAGRELERKIFDSVRVYNDYQDTGEIIIRPLIGDRGQRRNRVNARKTDRVWKINNLRDGIAQPTRRSDLSRLSDNVHHIELSFGKATDQRTIHLLNALLVHRSSRR
jgi:hypothetical protein